MTYSFRPYGLRRTHSPKVKFHPRCRKETFNGVNGRRRTDRQEGKA